MTHPSSYHRTLAKSLDCMVSNWNVSYMEDACDLTIADIRYLSKLLTGGDCSLFKPADSKAQLARHLVALMDHMPELPSGDPV